MQMNEIPENPTNNQSVYCVAIALQHVVTSA